MDFKQSPDCHEDNRRISLPKHRLFFAIVQVIHND
jgi:hypothetical protein